MREVIAVCQSGQKSTELTAQVLDRYFRRNGDRSWHGKASNACLDRVARELGARATRNTSVSVSAIHCDQESRSELFQIGVMRAAVRRGPALPDAEISGLAVVCIAILFHDLGKATKLFQAKLRRALRGHEGSSDALRHEYFSAAVWDALFGTLGDTELPGALRALTAKGIDKACKSVIASLTALHARPKGATGFAFCRAEGSLTHLIGMLILTHHRMPSGLSDHVSATAASHVRGDHPLTAADLAIAKGRPFWHETWWLARLHREAGRLRPGSTPASPDLALRASLMFADHLGSALKQPADSLPDHLANTRSRGRGTVAADSLSTHVQRVYTQARGAYDLLHRQRDSYPALNEGVLPDGLLDPEPSADPRFAWQGESARAARAVCAGREGGFFACILAGTGTGKTRGAPTILANAVMGDTREERRYLRMSLALGLRVLATQSACEYVDDLGYRNEDVSVLVGQAPLKFSDQDPAEADGSESQLTLPDWLRVEQAGSVVPQAGGPGEAAWLRRLSLDTGRGMPAMLDRILEHSGRNAAHGRRMIAAPVMVGTIDHLMGVAAPVNSRFLLQSLRLSTSDLILDEIDQYDGEDLAAIGRLIYQAGAAGRRVVIMSATLTPDIAQALHLAYSRGWAAFARSLEISAHVNLLLCADAPGAVFTNQSDEEIGDLLEACQDACLAGIRAAVPLRRSEILPPCEGWSELVSQIDRGCSRMHDINAVKVDGYRVSVGMVRLTRIAHTAALSVQLPSGVIGDRLRVMVCLHSQMPRLHRAYIEKRLKRALTRKGPQPDRGVHSLCRTQGLFERAAAAGVGDIEIVVVTSPVIETGNDLDFDYGILDPTSTRSIIQAAGRVRRHRGPGPGVNVLILGRSPIAMQGGRLEMPGVETRPAAETCVSRQSLEQFQGRLFAELAGDADFTTVSAAPILSSDIDFPLRDAEADLRRRMISTEETAPLGLYTSRLDARWNLAMTRSRMFRRSTSGEIHYFLRGESLGEAEWYIDLAPGTKASALRHAESGGLTVVESRACCLFEDLTESAWADLSQGSREMEIEDLLKLMQVVVPSYTDDLDPTMTYSDFTGFTRGSPEDLFLPFGKSI